MPPWAVWVVTSRSSPPGSSCVSASTKARTGFVAAAPPAAHAQVLPVQPSGRGAGVTTVAPASAATRPVPSDDSSSTTMSWSSGASCGLMEARAAPITLASSRAGMTTDTGNRRPAPGGPGNRHRSQHPISSRTTAKPTSNDRMPERA
jgi:hypothetical protein